MTIQEKINYFRYLFNTSLCKISMMDARGINSCACKISKVRAYIKGNMVSYIHDRKRYELKLSRFFTRILKLNYFLTPAVLDKFTNDILSITDKDNYTVNFLTGQTIIEAYRNCIGGSSCMTGSDSYKVGLYASNPDKIALAVLKRYNNSARCIVWLADDGKKYYDKIYSDNHPADELLYKRLEKMEMIDIYHNEGINIQVSDLKYNDGNLPYLDSLIYGKIKNNLLTLSTCEGDYDMQSTDGYLD